MASEEVAKESARKIMKFLCSYGGKILPRPSDGNLKYVGGETRVVSVPRDIAFSELLVKLSSLINGGDIVLKYKIVSEDLDALVTVKSDEDLKHMRDEYNRHESQGIPKLRTFLFPPNPAITLLENQAASDLRTVEQRYIDAINGIPRAPNGLRLPPVIANRPSFSISPCSSPKADSPEGNNHDWVAGEASFSNGYPSRRLSSMHRVRSSPSVCSLSSQPHQHHHQNHSLHQTHGHGGYSRLSPPPDFSSKGGSSSGWGPPPSHGQNHYISASRHDSGGGRVGYYEDFSGYGNAAINRAGRVPQSFRKHGLPH